MTQFTNIPKQIRELALDSGIVRKVAATTGTSRSTVSRIFAGEVCTRPNAEVVEALEDFMDRKFGRGSARQREWWKRWKASIAVEKEFAA